MLPVRLTQNNSSQKAISTFTIQKSQISWQNNTKISVSTSDTKFREPAKLQTLWELPVSVRSFWIYLFIYFLIFIFISCDLQTWQRLALSSMAKRWLLQGLKWHGGGLIIPSHTLPVAATRPLTPAHGLIRSQRRGQWLCQMWKRCLERLPWEGTRWGRSLLFQPFCCVIQRPKGSILPHRRHACTASAGSMTVWGNINCLCF